MQSIGVVAMLLAVSGCESEQHSGDQRSEGRTIDDKALTENVQNNLKNEPVYKFDNVEAKTFGGIVQLSGFVDTEAQKDRAGEVAQHVPGVREVENGIALKPPPMAPMVPTGSTNGNSRIYSD
jgi:osmotically-inducible protein OsmY